MTCKIWVVLKTEMQDLGSCQNWPANFYKLSGWQDHGSDTTEMSLFWFYMIFPTSNHIFKIKQLISQRSTKFLKKPLIGYAENSAKSFTTSQIINKSENGHFYRNFSSITAYKMTFLDPYSLYTIVHKCRTKTMLIELPKLMQKCPKTPQNTNNLSQKFNHVPIHIFISILTP